jgi:hypothetical protein
MLPKNIFRPIISDLKIHFLFFKTEFCEGTPTPLWTLRVSLQKICYIKQQIETYYISEKWIYGQNTYTLRVSQIDAVLPLQVIW